MNAARSGTAPYIHKRKLGVGRFWGYSVSPAASRASPEGRVT